MILQVFVTGASGWVGRSVVPELISRGHDVVGLARSDAAASEVAASGAAIMRGSIEDPTVVADAAARCDGVIHLAYHHDFSQMDRAAVLDLAVVEALISAYEGSDRPFVIASGCLGTPTEFDETDMRIPRSASSRAVIAATDLGVRGVVLRLPPTVHGVGDHGFVPMIIEIARTRGVSGYVGAGENCWPAVHVRDAASLFALAVERAPGGSVLHAVQDQGIAFREIAEAIAGHLGVPAVSVDPAQVIDHFGWIGMVASIGVPASSVHTRELMDWTPTGPHLLDDLEAGHYFEAVD
jgi:nucleoside-diphosphate-sugar epimerase